MEDFTMKGEEIQKLVQETMPKLIREKFTEGYGNPLKTAIEEEFKNNEGAIKVLVREIMGRVLSDKDFRDKLATEVIATIIQKGVRN